MDLYSIRLSSNTSLMPKTDLKQLIWVKTNLTELKNLN